MLKRIRDEKGFTLIELLVVILIIAILLAVAAPSFLGQQDKAKDSGMKQQMAVLYKAAKADAVDNPAGQGQFRDEVALVAALEASEPQLAANVAVGTVADTPAAGDIAVDVTGGTLTLVGTSDSNNVFVLTATPSSYSEPTERP